MIYPSISLCWGGVGWPEGVKPKLGAARWPQQVSVLAGRAARARSGPDHRAVGEREQREASLHVCLPWLQQEILQAVPPADAQQEAHWWV